MPPKRRASQHGAQSGSNKSTLNNAIRQTKNKYMALRRSSIKTASLNASLKSINNLQSRKSNESETSPRIDVGCSLASSNLAILNKGRGTNKILIQRCPLELNNSRSLTSLTGYNENRALFDPQSFDPELHMRLLESTKRCEELMGKLDQQQIDFAKAMSIARSPSITLPVPSTLINSNEPLKMDNNHSKQLDRMLRYMPTFNGKADENYDSYVIGVRQTLDAYANDCSEGEKLSAIRVKIGGDAREVLASSGTISSVEDLLSTMHVTYGRDQRTTIADVKQKVDETVRMFANRLRMNLKLLGWVGVDDSNKPNIVSLEFFINGLLPSISSEVRKLCPRTLDIAVDYAIQIESQKASVSDSKNCKSKLNNVATRSLQ